MGDYKLEKPFFHKGHMCYMIENNDGNMML